MSNWTARWQVSFHHLVDHLQGVVRNQEGFTVWLAAERSDFARWSKGRVQQGGGVEQAELTVRWIAGRRHASATILLEGRTTSDRAALDGVVGRLRQRLAVVPEDPYLNLPEALASTEAGEEPVLADLDELVQDIAEQAKGLDLVGILAHGPVLRAYADHRGQRNVFVTAGSHLDFSLVDEQGGAVKSGYAAQDWSSAELGRILGDARRDLALLQRPPKVLRPGDVRAYLTPAALEEVFSVMSWDGFSGRAQATRQSGLQRLIDGACSWHPGVHLAEDLSGGTAPRFQSDGFVKPDRVPLVAAGQHAGALVSPRTALEHGLEANGANPDEVPTALSMAGGDLPRAEAMARLGTGLWVSNLWYLNWSDQAGGRITGMTRFATLWVEDGEPVAPVAAMRFDDTLERMLGSQLEAITAETELRPSTSTYERRSMDAMRLPGVLLRGLTLTL